jgi:hypothetical protein
MNMSSTFFSIASSDKEGEYILGLFMVDTYLACGVDVHVLSDRIGVTGTRAETVAGGTAGI